MPIAIPTAAAAAPSPPDRVSCILANDALLTPFRVERVDERKRTVTGAVYADGHLVPSSQRIGERGGDLVGSVDPEIASRGAGHDRFSGRWLYGGHWMAQFGHFITETLTTLWPQIDEVDGLIFHPFIFGGNIDTWQLTMVRRLGWRVPIVIARHGAVVEELVIPGRPFILNESAGPEAPHVWSRVASPWAPSRKVFLSRSGLAEDPRRVPGDERLDALMASQGFDVLHPQNMSLNDQLDAVAGASVLAGVSGSALHLSAFSHPGAKVIEIGDARSPHRALPNQKVIDDAAGRTSGYVPFISAEGRRLIPETEMSLAALLSG